MSKNKKHNEKKMSRYYIEFESYGEKMKWSVAAHSKDQAIKLGTEEIHESVSSSAIIISTVDSLSTKQ